MDFQKRRVIINAKEIKLGPKAGII